MDSPGADTLNFNCPACDTSLRVPLSLAGVKGPCPHCRVEITSPQPVAFQHDPEAVSAPAHTPLPGPQPSPRAAQGESGPTSALQLQSPDALPRFPQSQPAESIIRAPASRVAGQASASRTAVDSEPITNGVPLPARRDLPESPKTRDSLPGPSSTAPAKRRVSLHPVSFVLVVLLSAGSGVVAMLLMNPLPAPPVPLPATTPLSGPAKPQDAGDVTSSGRILRNNNTPLPNKLLLLPLPPSLPHPRRPAPRQLHRSQRRQRRPRRFLPRSRRQLLRPREWMLHVMP
jgi:hypothetical protein